MNDIREPTVSVDAHRAGFSLIELLLAVTIVGLLAGIALPNLQVVRLRAQAAEISGAMDVVRIATQQHAGDDFTWPAEVGQGVVPPELVPYLPDGFTFQGNGYELDYENLSPVVIPGDPNTNRLIGVAVIADTDELSAAIVEFFGGVIVYSFGRKHTVIIDRS